MSGRATHDSSEQSTTECILINQDCSVEAKAFITTTTSVCGPSVVCHPDHSDISDSCHRCSIDVDMLRKLWHFTEGKVPYLSL